MGYLKLVFGCMFSGKTSYILLKAKKWRSIGKRVLIINHSLDNRYDAVGMVVSHDKISDDDGESISTSHLNSIHLNVVDISQYDVIMINEAQFFDDLVDNVLYWCETLNKHIVVSGLDGDFKRQKFGKIIDLIPFCDKCTKLTAYCKKCNDGTKASFTWKIKNNETDDIIEIGTEQYISLCRKHYLDNIIAS